LQVIRNSKKAASRHGWMAPLRDVAATSARYVGAPSCRSDRSLTGVRRHRGHIATGAGLWRSVCTRKKVDPPGGTTGRVGSARGWMRRPCWTQIHDRSVFERSGVPVRVKKRVKQEAFQGLKRFAWKERRFSNSNQVSRRNQ
jgi:hypothetical protein